MSAIAMVARRHEDNTPLTIGGESPASSRRE
jgi:hypothetical protein